MRGILALSEATQLNVGLQAQRELSKAAQSQKDLRQTYVAVAHGRRRKGLRHKGFLRRFF